jgi:asparagine synthase (glutamine-hydrolysing)
LPLPIPATIRFADLERAEESSWQDMVLRHLKLDERVSIEVRSELDLVGPLAGRLLLRHGILWPLNVYLHAALIQHARGGSLMTGMAGDSLFGGSRWLTAQDLLARRRKPEPRDVLRLGLAVAPRWVRQRVLRRRVEAFPWLRPSAREAFIESRSFAEANTPWRWDRWIDHLSRRRSWRIAGESMNELAAAEGTTHVPPLGDRSFLASVARTGGSRGMGNRTMVMRALFADVLPDPVLARSDKAVFGAAFIGARTREFAWAWKGQGVDPEVVDPDVLRAAWLGERFNPRSALLLQAAWLHEQQGGPAR